MEQVDLRGRFGVILVVVAALVAALLVNDIHLGQDLKGGTTLRFALDIDSARAGGRISESIDDEQVVKDTLAIIDKRINAYGLTETNLQPVGDNKFEISLPAGSEGDAQGIVDVVTQLGKLEFRIEVLPRESLRQPQDSEDPAPARPTIWPGDLDSFTEFKNKEIERWRAARSAGEVYQSTDPRFMLVKSQQGTGESPADFHVLEAGRPMVGDEELPYFSGDILDNPRVSSDHVGMPVVVFDIKGTGTS